MIINLSDDYRVASSTYSWDLQRKEKSKEGFRWMPFKYYATLAQALEGAYRLEIRMDDAEGLDECVKAVEAIRGRYSNIMDELVPQKYRGLLSKL